MLTDPRSELRRLLFETPSGPRQLLALVPLLPPRNLRFAGFVAASMQVDDPPAIGAAIGAIARRLTPRDRVQLLADIVRPGLQRPSRAALVPDDLVRTALEAVADVIDPDIAGPRAHLVRRLPQPERTPALQELLDATLRLSDDTTLEDVLAIVLPDLPVARESATELVRRRLRSGHLPSDALLTALVRTFPPTVLEQLLGEWSTGLERRLRDDLAARLLPGLPTAIQQRVASELLLSELFPYRADRSARERAAVLIAASPHLESRDATAVQRLILQTAQEIDSEGERAEVLSAFAAIAEGTALSRLRDAGLRLQHPRMRDRVLRHVRARGVRVPGFEPDQVPDLDQIAQLVAGLPTELWSDLANDYLQHLLTQWADVPHMTAPPGQWADLPQLTAPPPLSPPTRGEMHGEHESMPWDFAAPPAAQPQTQLPGAAVPVRERIVNTGFADLESPETPLSVDRPLAPAQAYYFWFSLDETQLRGSIELSSTPLPIEELPVGTRLHVILFGFEGGLEFPGDEDIGELILEADGRFRVGVQPARHLSRIPAEMLARRLFFSIRTPFGGGVARLRCNVYCRGVLLESRVVHATISDSGAAVAPSPALQSTVDYTLSRSLEPGLLRELAPHNLCVLLNDNGDGTHGLRLYGTDGAEVFKHDARMSDFELQGLIDVTRKALRRAAWGDESDWTEDKHYRYRDARRDIQRLTTDLARLAVAGYRTYTRVVYPLAGNDREALERLIHEPTLIQIAAKESAGAYVPAALIYDCHWDTNAYPISTTPYRMCPTFEAALSGSAPLEQCACFHAGCPTRMRSEALRADRERLISELGPVICPSGFWGFRHALGFPLSVGPTAEAPLTITYTDAPTLAAGIWTGFEAWTDHEARLRAGGRRVDVAASRQDLLRLLRGGRAHVVYFFCHGGLAADGSPCLFVGGPDDSGITPDNLEANGIVWDYPQPLVFINGCKTTALEPKLAFDFVSSFVRELGAAGVIGTEITVFEELASSFAETLLEAFLQGVPVGEAVRRARLALLASGNPLGLVYVPFVIGSLKMVARL